MRRFITLSISLALAYSAAFIGTFFTMDAVAAWYPTLTKPDLSPPNWIFGPVWTILYACMAIAAWLVYEKRNKAREANHLLIVYGAHLVINALWSIAFFGLQNPTLALVVIVVLWLCIAYVAVGFYRVQRTAGILFVPYLAWVSFATYLNLSIVLLN